MITDFQNDNRHRVMDFSNAHYLGELYQTIKQVLELPEWTGENLDALWDSLTGIMYVPADIEIIYHPKTKQSEALRACVLEIVSVFQEAEQEYHEFTLHVDL